MCIYIYIYTLIYKVLKNQKYIGNKNRKFFWKSGWMKNKKFQKKYLYNFFDPKNFKKIES